MKSVPLLSLILAACINAPHMEPQVRSQYAQEYSAVTVESECGSQDSLTGNMNPWDKASMASGVVISKRYVLTALHVVDCPELPTVHVMFPDGERFMMVVDREDRGLDIARLEVFSAGNLSHAEMPPTLAVPVQPEMLCSQTGFPLRRANCGPLISKNTAAFPSVGGNSGSAVYNMNGDLVGIVVMKFGTTVTRFAPVDKSWLSGT